MDEVVVVRSSLVCCISLPVFLCSNQRSVARTCNLIFIVLDVLKPLGDKKIIEGTLVYVDVQRTEPHNTPQAEYIPRMNHAIADALREGVPEDYIEKYIRKVIPRP